MLTQGFVLLVVVIGVITVFFDQLIALGAFQIFLHHLGNQFFETDFWGPSELLPSFGGIAQEGVNF